MSVLLLTLFDLLFRYCAFSFKTGLPATHAGLVLRLQLLISVHLQSFKHLLNLFQLVELELAQVAFVPLLNKWIRLRNKQPVDVEIVLLHELLQLLLLKLLRSHEEYLLSYFFFLLLLELEALQLFL